jgi:hypothetical protein
MKRFFSSNYNRSMLILIFSLLSVFGLIVFGLLQVAQALISLLRSGADLTELGAALGTMIGLGLCALFFLPPILDSIRQIRGGQIPAIELPALKGRVFLLLALAWIVLLILSSLASALGSAGAVLAAPLVTLGIAVSTLTFAWIGAGGLARASRRRLLGTLGLSLTGSSLIAIALQYIPIILVVVAAGAAAASNPQLLETIRQLQTQLENSRNMDELLNLLAPYITQPWALAAILVYAAGIAPLSEELVKPLAVWALGRRLRSPAEGFALGALSGAGFAIIEGTLSVSMLVATPYFGLPARLASSLMHVTLSAIVGWGIASALLEKRWGRMVGAYALSVTLHGLWNGSAVLAVYGSLRAVLPGAAPLDPLTLVSMALGVVTIGAIFVGVAVALPLLNQRLRRDIIPPASLPPGRTSDGLDSQGN